MMKHPFLSYNTLILSMCKKIYKGFMSKRFYWYDSEIAAYCINVYFHIATMVHILFLDNYKKPFK